MAYIADVYIWVAARFVMGFIFLWAFFDKFLGLGFATTPDKAWIRGGSPTAGFLKFGVTGPLSNFFHSLSGSTLIDWLFMLGLLGVGLALVLGIGLKIAGWSGALLMFFMWLALLPPKNNPIIDEHIVYMILLIGLATIQLPSGEYYGLGKWWKQTGPAQRYSVLK